MIDKKLITNSKVKKSLANILGINTKYLKVKIVKDYQTKNLLYGILINEWELTIFWKADEAYLIVFENVDDIIKISSTDFYSGLGGFILRSSRCNWPLDSSQKIRFETLIENLQLLDKLDTLTM